MKLLALILVVTSVSCQQATLLQGKNRANTYKGYKCHENLDGKATGVEASRGVEVQFFKSKNCSNGSHFRAWGTIDFKDPIEYRSVRLAERGSKKSDSIDVIKIESADEEEEGGFENSDDN